MFIVDGSWSLDNSPPRVSMSLLLKKFVQPMHCIAKTQYTRIKSAKEGQELVAKTPASLEVCSTSSANIHSKIKSQLPNYNAYTNSPFIHFSFFFTSLPHCLTCASWGEFPIKLSVPKSLSSGTLLGKHKLRHAPKVLEENP